MAVPPSALKDLVKLPVAAKWKQLGLQLGVPMHRLQQIQANNTIAATLILRRNVWRTCSIGGWTMVVV